MAKNEDVVKLFLIKQEGYGSSIRSSGMKLFSYLTCIAQWIDDGLCINKTYYSNTSSTHLNLLLKNIGNSIKLYTVINIPKETSKLNDYITHG